MSADIARGPPWPLLDKPLSRYVLAFAFLYLFLAWGSVFAVDAYNVWGTRDALVDLELQIPHAWFHLFSEEGVTEQLTYFTLGGTALIGAVVAGTLSASGRRQPGAFWALIAVTAILLLIEDAGNPRHRVAAYAVAFAPGERTPRIVAELAYFAVLAAVPLYAVLRYWRWPWRSRATRRYLVAGFLLYAAAALANGTRDIGGEYGWYAHAGAFLEETVFQGRLLKAPAGFWDDRPDPTGYMLMDTLFEESIEFLAAAMLLAAALAYARHVRLDPTIADGDKLPMPERS